jgi:hypothetical protein
MRNSSTNTFLRLTKRGGAGENKEDEQEAWALLQKRRTTFSSFVLLFFVFFFLDSDAVFHRSSLHSCVNSALFPKAPKIFDPAHYLRIGSDYHELKAYTTKKTDWIEQIG